LPSLEATVDKERRVERRYDDDDVVVVVVFLDPETKNADDTSFDAEDAAVAMVAEVGWLSSCSGRSPLRGGGGRNDDDVLGPS
jgi:hypothetical protein